MKRLISMAAALVVAASSATAQEAAWSIKTASDSAPPEELKEAIRGLLDNKSVQLKNAKGDTVVEVWFRKEVPVKATEAQIKNGLTYKEVPVSTVIGAIRVSKVLTDYRKQQVKPGVYTLRMALQPEDGDHMGTAPYNEFVLVSPAAEDVKPGLMEAKALHELSGKTTEGHPSILLLTPGAGAGAEPKLASKEGGLRVVLVRLGAKAGDKKATLNLGLTLVGVSPSA